MKYQGWVASHVYKRTNGDNLMFNVPGWPDSLLNISFAMTVGKQESLLVNYANKTTDGTDLFFYLEMANESV